MPEPNPLTNEDIKALRGCCRDCATARGLAQRMKAAGQDVESRIEIIDQIEREALAIQSVFAPLSGLPEMGGEP